MVLSRRPRHWTRLLQVRLALLGLSAVVCAVGLTIWALMERAEQATLAERQQLEIIEVERTAALLDQRVRSQIEALAVVGRGIPAAAIGNAGVLESLLRAQPLLTSQVDVVFVAGLDGRMQVIHDDNGWRRPAVNLADRAYFREVIATGRVVVSEPIIGRVALQPVVVIACPLTDGERVVGVISAGIRLRTHSLLAGLGGSVGHADSALVMVTDTTGIIVAHPDAGLVGSPLEAEARLQPVHAAWAAAGSALQQQGMTVSTDRALAAVAGMPRANWLVWRLEPRDAVLAPLGAARAHALRTGAAVALALTLLLLATLWWALRPLRLLKARAGRLFDENLDPQDDWPAVGGEIGALAAVLRRVGAQQRLLEKQNALVLQQLSSVMAAAPLGIMLTRDRRFELVNAEACRLLGRSRDELLGQPGQIIYASNEEYQRLGPRVGAAFQRREAFVAEMEFLRGQGQRFWGHLRGQPVDWDDADAGTIWTLADISDQIFAREQLEWAANHDVLTGLANRKALQQRLDRIVAAQPQAQPAALLVLDLDRFKPINDRHGHAAGDVVLRAVAHAIVSRVRGGDLVARVGGDEFAVLLERCPADVANRVAEDIHRAVDEVRADWHDTALSVGVSIGVAALADEFGDTGTWMAAADAACYDAKAAGRGTVRHATRPPLRLIAAAGGDNVP